MQFFEFNLAHPSDYQMVIQLIIIISIIIISSCLKWLLFSNVLMYYCLIWQYANNGNALKAGMQICFLIQQPGKSFRSLSTCRDPWMSCSSLDSTGTYISVSIPEPRQLLANSLKDFLRGMASPQLKNPRHFVKWATCLPWFWPTNTSGVYNRIKNFRWTFD